MDALTIILIALGALAVLAFAVLAVREVMGKKPPAPSAGAGEADVVRTPVAAEPRVSPAASRRPARTAQTAPVPVEAIEPARAPIAETVEEPAPPVAPKPAPTPVAVAPAGPVPEQRTLLARLSIMPADFDSAAAAAVAGCGEDDIEVLRQTGLLVAGPDEGRMVLAESVRAAAERALNPQDEHAARVRHAAHFAKIGHEAQNIAADDKAPAGASFDAFEIERAHFEAAFAYLSESSGCERELVDLVDSVMRTNGLHLTPELAMAWLEPALAAARAVGDRGGERDLLMQIAAAHSDSGDENRSIACLEDASELSRRLGERLEEGRCLGNIGLAYQRLKEPRKAVAYLERVAFIMRELGDRPREGVAMGGLGQAALDAGDDRAAIGYMEKHLEITIETKDKRGEVVALSALGNAYLKLDDVATAIGYFDRQLRIAGQTRDLHLEGNALGNLGLAQRKAGRPDRAVEYFTRQVEVAHLLGNAVAGVRSIGDLGLSHLAAGYASKALDCFDEQLKLARKLGDREAEAQALWNAARVVHSRGQIADAVTRACAALPILDELASPSAVALRAEIDQWRAESA